jgi:hypothetical protein
MKNLLALIAIVCICKYAHAQKELVTLDEHNKYIYYQVTDMPGISADTLYNRCLTGLTRMKPKQAGKPVTVPGSSITIKSKIMIYSSLTYVKHEDGELAYTLNIEFKDAKYRYWLTDFVFMPYQRNRYGVFERAPGVEIPAEKIKDKYDGRVLDNYLEQIALFGKQTGDLLKLYTANPQKKQASPTKIDTKKW